MVPVTVAVALQVDVMGMLVPDIDCTLPAPEGSAALAPGRMERKRKA
jgi:hypothetical protein